MITFKQFISEGGAATAKLGTHRATKAQVEQALAAVAKVLRLPPDEVKAAALGSVHLVLSGHKKDAGDVDLAMPVEQMEKLDALMRSKFEGSLNKGTMVGSYAVPVDDGTVQVDLMFSPDVEWSKFIYSSEHGRKSKYPGAVRNILMMTAVSMIQKPGEDAVKKVGDQVIARASRSMKLSTGLERLFKLAKQKKDGTYAKSLEKVEPSELRAHLDKFKPEADPITDPKRVVEWLFGKGVGPKDVETAEQVVALIKKLPNGKDILKQAAKELEKSGLPVPTEL